MNKEKVILITGAGGEFKQWTKPKKELKYYAKKHNMNFKFYDFDKMKVSYKEAKLKVIKENTIKYDYVIWVDYDVKVINNNINIMDHINRKVVFNVCSHIIMPSTLEQNIKGLFKSYNVLNSGVMVIKDKHHIVDLMQICLSQYFLNANWKDNSSLLLLTGHNNILYAFDNTLKKNSLPKLLHHPYHILDNRFNHIPNVKNYKGGNINNCVFLHLAGVKNREELLK